VTTKFTISLPDDLAEFDTGALLGHAYQTHSHVPYQRTRRRPDMPPSTASDVPVVAPAAGLTR
jgi:hypothetical protein